ncbi:hypothetical protein BV898_13740 [Hypsibius exemplaris]|uniref:Uncharacterized protein n=1 Tax=Hypsibius exemplaris TaxID=2072580 RepID=A0A1W0W9R4_HYPEX|nr:hypothetical protein BV898_13740 [Hypsibius exemplaris]
MADIDFSKTHEYWNDDDDDDDEENAKPAGGSTLPSHPSSQHSSYRPSQPEKVYTLVSLEHMIKAGDYWKFGMNKKLDCETLKHRFKFVKHRRYLYSWQAQFGDCGSRNTVLHRGSGGSGVRFMLGNIIQNERSSHHFLDAIQ